MPTPVGSCYWTLWVLYTPYGGVLCKNIEPTQHHTSHINTNFYSNTTLIHYQHFNIPTHQQPHLHASTSPPTSTEQEATLHSITHNYVKQHQHTTITSTHSTRSTRSTHIQHINIYLKWLIYCYPLCVLHTKPNARLAAWPCKFYTIKLIILFNLQFIIYNL